MRLGFNLWYAAHEDLRMCKGLPVERYAARFMELFRQYQSQMNGDPDFCWAFGLGISLFWFEFPGATEALGEALLSRAKELDPFYGRLDQEEMQRRFFGRGIFAKYYGVAERGAPPSGGAVIPLGDSGASERPPSAS